MTFNKSLATRIYIFAMIGVIIWLLVDRGSEMFDLFSEARTFPLITVIGLAFLPFFANTAFWTIALKELGEEITWKQVNEAAIKTTLTRYLPGGIWLFASRSLALKNEGVATHSLIALFGLENLLAIPIAVLIGSLLLVTSYGVPAWIGWVSLSLLATIAVLARPALDRLMTWWSKRKGLNAPKKISNSGIFRMYLSLFLYWIVFGTVFYAYLRSVGQSVDWATAVGGFSLFWRISLFAPFAPHGLGVFEPSFIALADWTLSALLIVGAFRVVLLVRDLVLTGIAGFFIKKSSRD